MKAAAWALSTTASSAVCGEARRIAPAAPISRPSLPVRALSQAKKGWPSSLSTACELPRTWAAWLDQFSASRRLTDSCSPKRRIRVRLAPRLSSRLVSSLSPEAVA